MTREMENKNATALVGALTAVLFLSLFAQTANIPAAYSQTDDVEATVSNDCTHQTSEDMHLKDQSLDTEKALRMANSDQAYLTAVNGNVSKFNGINTIWNLDLVNCKASTKQQVNVDYSIYLANGTYVKSIAVSLDPSLSKVISTTEYVAGTYSHQSDSINWAGNEYAANSFTYPTPPACSAGSTANCVWESFATWTIPTVSVPTTPSFACRTDQGKQPCDLAQWTGLEDSFLAGNGNLAQAGTDGKIVCSPSCTTTYFMWYEFLSPGVPATNCIGLGTTSGHSIRSIVTSHGKTGGTTTLYDISLLDLSNITGCSTTSVSYTQMAFPRMADFINERAQYNSMAKATLAKFSSDAITGSMYYNGGSHGISTPNTNGWYNSDRMKNGANINISYGSISGDVETLTWLTSAGT